MAKAGSCKIGLNPKPSILGGNILKKGFEVKIVNNKKPIIINAWISKVFKIKDEFSLLINLYIK